MNSKKINVFFSTFNAILFIAGYQLVSVVFGFVLGSNDSQMITIPYRLFAFAICVIVILLNLKKGVVINRPSKVLCLFWVLALCRFFYDMYIRTDIFISGDYKFRIGMFMIIINIFPMISLFLSFNYIDFNKVLRFVYLSLSVATLLTFLRSDTMQIVDEYSRGDTMGMSSIGTGHLGLSTFIMSVYLLLTQKKKFFGKVLFVIIAIVSILVMLRTGSRGPLLSLIVVIGFFIAGKSKSPVVLLLIIITLFLLSDFIISGFLEVLDSIAPNLSRRLSSNQEEGQIASRMFHYQYAWSAFLDSPIIGKYFAIYLIDHNIYAHNLFLDALMQLGIIGFSLIVYVVVKTCKIVLNIIKQNSFGVWIGLLYIQYLSLLMVSSSYYLTPVFSLSTIMLFMLSDKERCCVTNDNGDKQLS